MRAHQAGFSFIKFFLIIFMIAAVLFGFYYFGIKKNKFFPISTIKIVSDYEHVSKTHLKKIIAVEVKKANFLTLNINQLKKKLLAIPWVQDATIHRAWPGTLLIKIEEQKPIALFNEKSLVNRKGQLFYPGSQTIPQHLPMLKAPETELQALLTYYEKMEAMLQPFSLKIVFLEIGLDGNLKAVLNNGISILVGKTDIFSRWKRFVMAYPMLKQEMLAKQKRISQVDLRYSHGFAVRWSQSLINLSNP